jgi:membrane-associated protease RseP (regulator of RpoE activity)
VEDQAYLLISPSALQEGRLIFDPALSAAAVYRWFGADAASGVVQGLPDRRDRHIDWFPLMAGKLRQSGITDWSSALTELIASSIAIRILTQQGETSAAESLKRTTLARGHALLPYVLQRLAEYERERGRYRSIEEFAPRLFDAIDELEPFFGGGEPGDLGLADVWLTEEGVPVKAVTPGSLAAQAGIRKGDTISAIGGIRINGSESYLKAWDRWEKAASGDRVPFKVKRGKTVMLIEVTMRRAGTFRGFRRKPGGQ